MSKSKTKELAKQEEQALSAVGGGVAGFEGELTDAEVMDASNASLSYFRLFPKQISAKGARLILRDNATGETTELEQPLPVVVLYYHGVQKLLQGHLEGANADVMDGWTEEQKQLVAVNYGKHGGEQDPGTFAPDYTAWLEDQERRKALVNRCFVFVWCPQIANEAIICTFGATAFKSLGALDQSAMRAKSAKSLLQATLTLEPKENDDGKDYDEPTFRFVTDENGFYVAAVPTKDAWLAGPKKLADDVKALHGRQIEITKANVKDIGEALDAPVNEDDLDAL